MKSSTKRIAYAAGLTVVILTLLLAFQRSSKSTRYVAYIGRYVNTEFDTMHEVILREYLERLSDRFEDIELELLTIDIQNSADRAIREYEKLANHRDLLAVIDNTWGEHMQPCAESIRRKAIPVISLNADRGAANYGPTVLFNGNEDETPRAIAKFMRTALQGAPEVILIGEETYQMSRGLSEQLGVPNWHLLSSPSFSDSEWATLKAKLTQYLKSAPERATIVLGTHRYWGNAIVALVDQIGENVDIVGPLSATSSGKPLAGDQPNGNRYIFMSRPEDTLSLELTEDLERFAEAYPEYFEEGLFNTPSFVRRCMDAVSIIGHATKQIQSKRNAHSLSLSGARMEDYARELSSMRHFVEGNDIYIFDHNSSRLREVQFEVHEGGKRSSFPIQLNKNLEDVDVVVFGIELVSISRIRLEANSFHADFYYILNIPKSKPELENSIHFKNLRGVPRKTELFSREADQFIQKLYRVSGEFEADFELKDFPMDQQELILSLDMVHDSDKVAVTFDKAAFDRTKSSNPFEIGGWQVTGLKATVDNVISTTMRGGMLTDGQPQKIQTLNVRLGIKRLQLRPFITITLPLLMIGLAALLILQVRGASFRLLGEIAVVIFLSVVTYSIAYAEFSPGSETLSKADMLFGSTLLVVLITFVAIVGLAGRYGSEAIPPKVSSLLRGLGIALCGFYLATLIAIPLA